MTNVTHTSYSVSHKLGILKSKNKQMFIKQIKKTIDHTFTITMEINYK